MTRPISALAVLAFVTVTTSASAATVEERFEKTLPLAAGGSFSVSNINGAVQVETWSRDEVKIVAIKKAEAGTDARAREVLGQTTIAVAPSPGAITVQTKVPRIENGFLSWIFGNSASVRVAYTITVPVHANVTANTVNGHVTVKDVAGKVKTTTVNGGVSVAGLHGSLDAETVNGAIEAELDEVAAGSMSFSTVNGSISLSVPQGLKARVAAETVNGGIDVDLPMNVIEKGRRFLKADLNGGGGVSIDLETTNGGIHINGG